MYNMTDIIFKICN